MIRFPACELLPVGLVPVEHHAITLKIAYYELSGSGMQQAAVKSIASVAAKSKFPRRFRGGQ